MKLQDVLLKAMAKKITWWEAAEIIGVTDRTMRRWRERMEEHGYTGLADRRKGKESDRRVPLAQVEEVLRLYQTRPENVILMPSGEPHNRLCTSRDGATREKLTGKHTGECSWLLSRHSGHEKLYVAVLLLSSAPSRVVSCRVRLNSICPWSSNCLFFRFAVSLSSL